MAEQFAVAIESTYGVNPGSGAKLYSFVSDDMVANVRTVEDPSYGDFNPRDARIVGASNSGGLRFATRLGDLNPLLAAAFSNQWSTPLAITGNISAAKSDNSLNGTNLFADVKVGQWIKLDKLAQGINGYHFVTAKPNNSKLIIATPIDNDATGDGDETITGSMLRPGNLLVSATVERQHPEENLYFLATGQVVQQMRFEIAIDQLMQGNISFFGKPEQPYQTSQIGSVTPAVATPALGPVNEVKAIREGSFGTDTTLGFSAISLDFSYGWTGEEELSKFGIQRVLRQRPTITGQFSAYLGSSGMYALLSKCGTRQTTKISMRWEDEIGNAMVVTMHRVFLRQYRANAPGQGQSKFAVIDFTAETDRTTDQNNALSVQLDWFPAS